MFGVFRSSVECTLEISRATNEHPDLKLRMGVHSGAVSSVIDANGRASIAGAGINLAQPPVAGEAFA